MMYGLGRNSRILVVGTSGSGKSTLAGKLSVMLGIRDIELDALYWGPDWTERDPEQFRSRIIAELETCHGCVIHGNYRKVRDLTWGTVDTVIWLDYPRIVVMARVLRRTVRRVVTREKLWAGNVETFRKSFLAKDSIIRWAWDTYSLRKKQYEALFAENPYNTDTLIRFSSPRETDRFLTRLRTERTALNRQ